MYVGMPFHGSCDLKLAGPLSTVSAAWTIVLPLPRYLSHFVDIVFHFI